MKINHIYLFSSYNTQGISTRYRGVSVLKELEIEYNIKITFVYPGYKLNDIINFFTAFTNVLFSFQNDKIVIYQKLHSKGLYTGLLKILIKTKPNGTILGIKNPDDKKEIEYYFKDNTNITLDIPEAINWLNENSIYKRIKELDIGVSPMVNHEFTVAKSAFKAKQYLSCGVPVLARHVGENLTFVKNGVNGFICKNSIEFKQRIIQISKMTNSEYTKLRNNTFIKFEDFSMKNYCDNLINQITQHNTWQTKLRYWR